jgi:hypothetical protein
VAEDRLDDLDAAGRSRVKFRTEIYPPASSAAAWF